MKHASALLLASALLATPVLAGPAPKRPACQAVKAPARDTRRADPCRKPAIPPLVDPTPMFLASTAAAPVELSPLS